MIEYIRVKVKWKRELEAAFLNLFVGTWLKLVYTVMMKLYLKAIWTKESHKTKTAQVNNLPKYNLLLTFPQKSNVMSRDGH